MLKRSAPPALLRAQARDRRLRRRLIRQGVIVPPGSRQATTSLIDLRRSQTEARVVRQQTEGRVGGIGDLPDVQLPPNHGPGINRRSYYVDNVLPAIISTVSENAES